MERGDRGLMARWPDGNQICIILLLQKSSFPQTAKNSKGNLQVKKHQRRGSLEGSVKWPKGCGFAITKGSNFPIKDQLWQLEINGNKWKTKRNYINYSCYKLQVTITKIHKGSK